MVVVGRFVNEPRDNVLAKYVPRVDAYEEIYKLLNRVRTICCMTFMSDFVHDVRTF